MAATTLLSDNGASSGLSGYTLTGGSDGTLELQTTTAGGTPTTAISISNAQVVTFVNPPVGVDAFPSGTAMLFLQTAAPTGWTKSTAHDNKALRVVSGTAGSGGSVAFTTAFASQTPSGSVSVSGTVGATTLSTSQIPSHNHLGGHPRANGFEYNNSLYGTTTAGSYAVSSQASGYYTGNFAYTSSTGSGGSHDHSFSGSGSFSGSAINLAVQYVDTIIATKN
jgi:hypothetical protein